jgi:xanthine dehydrogenase small subunit
VRVFVASDGTLGKDERMQGKGMRGAETMADSDRGGIRFLLDGEVVTVDAVDPTRSVLSFLREDMKRTGTKEGCAEGDCGACTVVVGEIAGDGVALKTVNACIQFVPALDGKALFTVEDLRQPNGDLHPVQQAMVDCHGSQCGFCTPGFVMSLWALYLGHDSAPSRPNGAEIRSALTGNLCRCTGYRPILDAGERMFDLPRVPFDRAALHAKLRSIARDDSLAYEHAGRRFFAPRTVAELAELKARQPQATLLAGCTDIGLWVTKQLRDLPDIIYVGNVDELKVVHERDGVLRIGAGVSLTDAYGALARHYPELTEMWERFASPPIRNAGTMGGNVANGSPIGDSMPGLIALGATVTLTNRLGSRTLPMEDLYVGYMKKAMAPDEFLEAIEVPLPSPALRFRTYKLSKRFDSDISAVCAAFAIELDGNRIARCRVAYGGVAATPRRASATERALEGAPWSEATARAAMDAIAADYTPLTDMRASADYRLRTAQNLLYRFFLETCTDRPLRAAEVSVFAAA